MRKYTPLGPNVLIKVLNGELKIGSIIVAAEGTREAMAREEAEILALGEDANDDLNVKPKVGDKVLIARYDGKMVEDCKDKGYELRVIQDNRLMCLVEESKDE